jgi:hypothetical protein
VLAAHEMIDSHYSVLVPLISDDAIFLPCIGRPCSESILRRLSDIVPLAESVEAFFAREVKAHVSDA